MQKLAKAILSFLVTLLICLGGIELIGYFWEQNTVQGPFGWTLVAARRLHLERHGSIGRTFDLFRPNEDYFWQGIPVHINSRGFRTQEFALPKPPETFRILNVGDSVAFGWAAELDDTYGKIIESSLNEYGSAQRYEVINAGIPGWGLRDEQNFILEEGLSYQPNVIILDLTVVNDIAQARAGPDPVEQPALLQWLRDNTYGWPFLTIETRLLLSRTSGPEAIPVLNPPRQASAYYPLDADDLLYDQISGDLEAIEKSCHQHGVPLILVAFLTAFQVNSANHPDVPQRVLGARARAAGIAFVDLLPIYKDWCIENGMELCEGYQNSLFADVWMHPNPMGHRLAAEQILQALPQ